MDTTKSIQSTQTAKEEKAVGYSFYFKLFFLYFLNLTDWICTEALIGTGKFYEANPIMQPVLGEFLPTLLIKGALPLALIIICAVVYRFADSKESFFTSLLLYIGIVAYALVNLWHICNFVLLFSSF